MKIIVVTQFINFYLPGIDIVYLNLFLKGDEVVLTKLMFWFDIKVFD